MKTTVYWIRRKHHTDITTQGYVGITKDLENRIRTHFRRPSNLHLKHALNKYNDIIAEPYFISFDRDYAKALEKQLRPNEKIGWNENVGGDEPPDIRNYPEAMQKISNSIKSLGMSPFCENTHSKESLEKAKCTKLSNKLKWYHDPISLEYRMIKTAVENIPEGWMPGRVPKPEKATSQKGNFGHWKIFINNIEVFCGKNLKKYLTDNGYSSIYPNLTKVAKTGEEYYSRKFDKTFKVIRL